MSELAIYSPTAVPDAIAPVTATLLHVVKTLSFEPACVQIDVSSAGAPQRFFLSISVAPADLARVVGAQERTAQSLQSLASAMARKAGQQVELEFKSHLQADA